MKAYTKVLLTALGLSAALYSCRPDNVRPRGEEDNQGPTTAFSEVDTHQLYTPFCSDFDTLPLISEMGSSLTVNFQCTANCPKWGYVSSYNSNRFFVAKFRLAQTWFVDFANSQFTLASNFNLGTNLIPQTSNDWLSFNPAPDVNSWQMVVPLSSIVRDQSNCFAFAARLSVWKISFFGGFNPASRRTLWAYNANYNVAGHPNASPSPYVTPSCWTFCAPEPDTLCQSIVTGLPSSAGPSCATLTPPSGQTTSAVTYAWSTGATTQSINVCPTSASTYYTVTVTETPSRVPVGIYVFRLAANDVQCFAGNSPHHKVKVCHLPPGNPANQQNICIDWSGVPAHVAAYRAPGSNPRQGHDSGCYIGECGYDPCN